MNKSEIKICQNCKASFEINASDFEFYAKIKVPPPTWCPECRMVRRFLFRGWRKLYKRKTEGYDADVYSKYSLDTNLKIYHESYYVSDNWDAAEYGREYDFSRPFFAQFADLFRAVPKPHRDSIGEMTGSDYCDNAGFLKNCYLVFNTGLSENCMYGTDIDGSRDCADVARVKNCELCYDLFDAESCYRVNFSAECVQCSDVWFSKNLVGCDNCVGCVGLRNKQYYIFNEPHTKKEYFKKIKEFNFSSFKNVSQSRKDASIFTLRFPARFMRGYQYVNATGDYIYHSKNVRNSFNVANMENCAYCQLALFGKTTDSMDVAVAGGDLLYEGMVSAGTRVLFGLNNFAKDLKNLNLSELQYCAQCRSCHNLFACVGLRNKQYCILNKQYTKEEYEKLVPQIIEHMNIMPYIDKKG
ncbi:hypothetical protein HZB06_01440, partial [Candidatus Wolfebacteria bacterium]|nr:hypothetical protein [Candidatus Wolfebacteria bacterium]